MTDEPKQPPEDTDLDIYSKDGETSLFRLLNSCRVTQAAVGNLPIELLEKTEFELLRKPDDRQRRLKISFWNEYRRCQRQGKRAMVLNNIIYGVCGNWYWQNKVVKAPEVLAWLITPPTEESLVWQELLELGQNKLRKVLKLPLVEKRYWKDKTGEVHVEKRTNVSLVKEVRAIVEMLQNRLHGTVVQRQQIESKSLSVSAKATDTGVQAEMAQIKALLGQIESVAGKIPELDAGVTVEGEIPEDEVPTDKNA